MSQNLICYCFNYTADDIRQDLKKNGQSTIMARIIAEKKKGAAIAGIKMLALPSTAAATKHRSPIPPTASPHE